MKLTEFLVQGRQLRQQDRTSTIAYFEQCLQNVSDSSDQDLIMTARILLDLAIELMATKQPENLKRATKLVQQAENVLHQNLKTESLELDNEHEAYLFYAQGILALELGELRDVLNILQGAYAAYGNNLEGQALIDDAIAHYYLKVGDLPSALMHFERSLSVRLEIEDECAIAKSYAYLGQLYLRKVI